MFPGPPSTFAYLLLTSPTADCLASEDGHTPSTGDIIELSMSLEDQATCIKDVRPFDDDERLDRIAPVQLTRNWNPAQYLLDVMAILGCEPTQFRRGEEGHIFHFSNRPDTARLEQTFDFLNPPPEASESDRKRFEEVLLLTLQLAISNGNVLLFIGDWGWDYDVNAEYLLDSEPILRAAGMHFLTRHG